MQSPKPRQLETQSPCWNSRLTAVLWELEDGAEADELTERFTLSYGRAVARRMVDVASVRLWFVDDKLFLRNYLISRIEKQYDAAKLLSIPKMLDAFVDRATKEAQQEGVEIRPTRNMNKGRTTRFVRRIESEFYEEMAKEVKKIKEQLR